MQNVYIDTYGDILNDILNIKNDSPIDPILKQIVEGSKNVEVSKEPIVLEAKKKSKKKTSKKKDTKEPDKIRHVRVKRIK